MNTMKKLLSLILALAMVMSMTACGSEPKGSVSAGTGAGSTPEPTPESTPEPEVGLELGSMVGGTYENGFAGIGCKLDGTWTYLTEEEILAINELTIDAIEDEEIAAKLSDKGTFYDMAAMSEESGSSVNVVVENLGLLYGTVLDTGACVDAVLGSLDDQLAAAGMKVTASEKVSLDFCGKTTDGIAITSTMTVNDMDIVVYQRQAYVKAGTYMFCVTATSYIEDATADILDLFYAV